MAGASETELREAFKLFDADGDGMISAEELKTLISKVGGEMADAEAKALIHAADKDGNQVKLHESSILIELILLPAKLIFFFFL